MSAKLEELSRKYPAPESTTSIEACKHHTIDVSKLKQEDIDSLNEEDHKVIMKWVYELFVPVEFSVSDLEEFGFVQEGDMMVRYPQGDNNN